VLILDVDEAESDKLLATFDPIAAMAESDAHALDALLRNVDTGSEALSKMLAELAEGAGLYQDKEVIEDEVPEPPVDPITKAGDLWILGDHRVLCCDSTKAEDVAWLMAGAKAQLVITDPPYGVSYSDKNAFLNAIDKGNRNQTKIENDHLNKKETQAMWGLAFKNMADAMGSGAVVYCFMPQGGDQMMMMMMMMEGGIEPRHELIWLKNNHVLGRSDYNYKHEPILYAWKKGGHKFYGDFSTSVIECKKPHASKLHPTMKPVELVAILVKNSSQLNETIYDPFLGSGTTLIAAEQLGRKCYGMEISPAYCDVIVQRWEKLTGKTATLEVKNG
jgi:DNA modification methylase